MAEVIRHIRQDEWDIFMQMLEKSYGHPVDYFQARYPDIYHPSYRDIQTHYVIEKKGKIVSHVGLFPFDSVVEDVKITLGGILGVGTLPGERNKGYMKRLFSHVITEMKKKDISVSVLWGDRYRYGNFGWENAGEKLVLQFTERSLIKSGIKPHLRIREVSPHKAVSVVRELYTIQRYRVDRGKRMRGVLTRAENRVWLSDDGYLCGRCAGDKLIVNEAVSLSGKEASLIMAVMNWCFVREAEMAICSQDRNYIRHLIDSAYIWDLRHEGMFRLNNCSEFLRKCKRYLEKKAFGLKTGNFSLSMGLRLNDSVDVVGVNYKSGRMDISKKRMPHHVEVDEREVVRYLLGDGTCSKNRLGIFSALLPVPIHIPELDMI